MNSIRDLRNRLASVKNTQKITRAMKLVAAAELKKLQRSVLSSRQYSGVIRQLTEHVSRRLGSDAPTLWRRRAIRKLDYFVIMSDKGLCGGFNDFLARRVLYDIELHARYGIKVSIFSAGKKAQAFLKNSQVYLGPQSGGAHLSQKIAELATQRFLNGESDGADIVFNLYKSAVLQEPAFLNIVPLHWRGEGIERNSSYLYEPDKLSLLDDLAGKAITWTVKQSLLESSLSEQAARFVAMNLATNNAQDMLDDLTVQYYGARQGAITRELLDIVGGSVAICERSEG